MLLTRLTIRLGSLCLFGASYIQETFPRYRRQLLLGMEKMVKTFSPWQSALEHCSCNCGSKK